MVLWVSELTGQSVIDAYQLVSQAVLTPIANVVDTAYTVVCKFPKSVLQGAVAMGGMHERLSKIAAASRD
jgi:amidase